MLQGFFVQKIEDNRKLSSIRTDLKCPVGIPRRRKYILYLFEAKVKSFSRYPLFRKMGVVYTHVMDEYKRKEAAKFTLFPDLRA